MAKIGLENFRFGRLHEDENGGATYEAAQKPGKAVSCKVSITNNSAELYADNVLAESDTSFQSGTVTMGIDKDDFKTQAVLLGHEYSEKANTIARSVNDAAPYVGLGRIVTMVVDGEYKYKVEFLNKVKFSEPSQDDTTKGSSTEFGTVELEGKVAALADGRWSEAAVYDTREEALETVEGIFGTYTATTAETES